MTVKQLKEDGYEVKIYHNREVDDAGQILCRGGSTEVLVTDSEDREFIGVAVCSDKEGYNKKIGVQIACGRAIKNMNRELERLSLQAFGENNGI